MRTSKKAKSVSVPVVSVSVPLFAPVKVVVSPMVKVGDIVSLRFGALAVDKVYRGETEDGKGLYFTNISGLKADGTKDSGICIAKVNIAKYLA